MINTMRYDPWRLPCRCRDNKPNSEERKRIAQVLKLPPNKPLHADDKALLWRFRYSLTQDPRALTKFLKCVDWSDASEAKQVGLSVNSAFSTLHCPHNSCSCVFVSRVALNSFRLTSHCQP